MTTPGHDADPARGDVLAAPAAALLRHALDGDRVHSAYLVSGPAELARAAALAFARGVVCRGAAPRPCGACPPCRRSDPLAPGHEPVALDGSGKKGPLHRHVGEHPDLLWTERGEGDTRVRVAQVRSIQAALRLRTNEGGARAAVIADAEWLNAEAQNGLLRLLEEPPPRTTLVLVAVTAAGLLATLRSRCQRVVFPPASGDPWLAPDAPEEISALRERAERAGELRLPELLDWAEEYRGGRAVAAEGVQLLLQVGGAVLRAHVREAVARGERDLRRVLDAEARLRAARRALVQRNANPQMVAERALLALRGALA
jgi:DNA polymerase III delta prime subunit